MKQIRKSHKPIIFRIVIASSLVVLAGLSVAATSYIVPASSPKTTKVTATLIPAPGVVHTQAAPAPVLSPKAITSLGLMWPADGEAAVGAPGYATVVHGDQTPLPTASVAKLMTALVVLKKRPLSLGQTGPMISITDTDVSFYHSFQARDGSVVPVYVGEQLSEYDALEALLLPSANNMADTLAVWACGSLDAYVSYASGLATSLGMAHSSFTDPSGFSATTVSTASDLVMLGETAANEPIISDIVARKTAVIPVAGTIHNTNSELGMNNISGMKTGNTNKAGGVFIGREDATLPDGSRVPVISAVIGTPTLPGALEESVSLLASTVRAIESSSAQSASNS